MTEGCAVCDGLTFVDAMVMWSGCEGRRETVREDEERLGREEGGRAAERGIGGRDWVEK